MVTIHDQETKERIQRIRTKTAIKSEAEIVRAALKFYEDHTDRAAAATRKYLAEQTASATGQ